MGILTAQCDNKCIYTLNIAGMSLSSRDLSPTLALFDADTEGGDEIILISGGLDAASKPFMVIIPFPSLFRNSTNNL
jgi:hypothetical protein